MYFPFLCVFSPHGCLCYALLTGKPATLVNEVKRIKMLICSQGRLMNAAMDVLRILFKINRGLSIWDLDLEDAR